jgi:hypothetical protein
MTKPRLILFHLAYTALLLGASVVAAQDKTSDAKAFADSVEKMFDQGKYSDMYDSFDPRARTLTRDQWIETAETLAKQRGKLITRTLANKTNSMGIYRFLYSSSCENGKVFEDIGVSDNTGSWRIVGFVIKPNLE